MDTVDESTPLQNLMILTTSVNYRTAEVTFCEIDLYDVG